MSKPSRNGDRRAGVGHRLERELPHAAQPKMNSVLTVSHARRRVRSPRKPTARRSGRRARSRRAGTPSRPSSCRPQRARASPARSCAARRCPRRPTPRENAKPAQAAAGTSDDDSDGTRGAGSGCRQEKSPPTKKSGRRGRRRSPAIPPRSAPTPSPVTIAPTIRRRSSSCSRRPARARRTART